MKRDTSLDPAWPIYHQAEAISPNGFILAISSDRDARSCGGNPNPKQPGNSTLAFCNTQRGDCMVTLPGKQQRHHSSELIEPG